MHPSRRATVAVTLATLATSAQAQSADSGGISTAGWMSVLAVIGICIALVWVFRKTN